MSLQTISFLYAGGEDTVAAIAIPEPGDKPTVAWQAKVNGETRPVLRVYGDFMGCVVDAGRCEVEFNFRPKSLQLGGWLSAVGLGLALLSFSVSRFLYTRQFRRGPETP